MFKCFVGKQRCGRGGVGFFKSGHQPARIGRESLQHSQLVPERKNGDAPARGRLFEIGDHLAADILHVRGLCIEAVEEQHGRRIIDIGLRLVRIRVWRKCGQRRGCFRMVVLGKMRREVVDGLLFAVFVDGKVVRPEARDGVVALPDNNIDDDKAVNLP